jgi:hypothetical protein
MSGMSNGQDTETLGRAVDVAMKFPAIVTCISSRQHYREMICSIVSYLPKRGGVSLKA